MVFGRETLEKQLTHVFGAHDGISLKKVLKNQDFINGFLTDGSKKNDLVRLDDYISKQIKVLEHIFKQFSGHIMYIYIMNYLVQKIVKNYMIF